MVNSRIDNTSGPVTTWLGTIAAINNVGDVQFEARTLVQDWVNGVYPDYGLVVRGITPDSGEVLADSREGNIAPMLVVSYDVPDKEGALSDVGDAPDSSNHHSINNTAYPGRSTLGQFPTVVDPQIGMSTGPLHVNPILEGYLGDHLSHEIEADMMTDADFANNILLNVDTGVLADIADRDHGDERWRDRNVDFAHCESELLGVRISRGEDAQVLMAPIFSPRSALQLWVNSSLRAELIRRPISSAWHDSSARNHSRISA